MIPWIIIAITLTVVLLGAVFVIRIKNNKGKPIDPDYRTWFIIGITWIPLGLATENSVFWIMGIVFMILGLANKDKWKKQKKLSELKPKERKSRILVLGILGLLFLFGVVVLLLTK